MWSALTSPQVSPAAAATRPHAFSNQSRPGPSPAAGPSPDEEGDDDDFDEFDDESLERAYEPLSSLRKIWDTGGVASNNTSAPSGIAQEKSMSELLPFLMRAASAARSASPVSMNSGMVDTYASSPPSVDMSMSSTTSSVHSALSPPMSPAVSTPSMTSPHMHNLSTPQSPAVFNPMFHHQSHTAPPANPYNGYQMHSYQSPMPPSLAARSQPSNAAAILFTSERLGPSHPLSCRLIRCTEVPGPYTSQAFSPMFENSVAEHLEWLRVSCTAAPVSLQTSSVTPLMVGLDIQIGSSSLRLLQLSSSNRCVLFQFPPKSAQIPHALQDFLQSRDIIKVSPEIWSDALDIFRDLNTRLNACLDLCTVHRALQGSSVSLEQLVLQALGQKDVKAAPVPAYLNWDEGLLHISALQWAATSAQAAKLIARATVALQATTIQPESVFHLDDLSPTFCRIAADWCLQLKCMQRERESFVEYPLLGVESVHKLASSASPGPPEPVLLLTTDVHDLGVQAAQHFFLVIRGSDTNSERIEKCALRRVLVAENKVELDFPVRSLASNERIVRVMVRAQDSNSSQQSAFGVSVLATSADCAAAVKQIRELVQRPLDAVISCQPRLLQALFSVRPKKEALDVSDLPALFARPDVDSAVTASSSRNGVELDEDQQRAINMAVNSPICSIDAGPGCGRTYLLASVVADVFRQRENELILCIAPNDASATALALSLSESLDPESLALVTFSSVKASSDTNDTSGAWQSAAVFNRMLQGGYCHVVGDVSADILSRRVLVCSIHVALSLPEQALSQRGAMMIDDASQVWDCLLMLCVHRLPSLHRLLICGDSRGLSPVSPLGLPAAHAPQHALMRSLSNPNIPRSALLSVHRCPAHLSKMVSSLFYESRLRWSDSSTFRATWYHNTSGTDLAHHLLTVVRLFRVEMARPEHQRSVVILTLDDDHRRRLLRIAEFGSEGASERDEVASSPCPDMIGRVFSAPEFCGRQAAAVLLYVPKVSRSTLKLPSSSVNVNDAAAMNSSGSHVSAYSQHSAALRVSSRYAWIQYACSRASQKLVIVGPRLSRRRSARQTSFPPTIGSPSVAISMASAANNQSDSSVSKKSLLHAIAYYVQQPHLSVLGLGGGSTPATPTNASSGSETNTARQSPAHAQPPRTPAQSYQNFNTPPPSHVPPQSYQSPNFPMHHRTPMQPNRPMHSQMPAGYNAAYVVPAPVYSSGPKMNSQASYFQSSYVPQHPQQYSMHHMQYSVPQQQPQMQYQAPHPHSHQVPRGSPPSSYYGNTFQPANRPLNQTSTGAPMVASSMHSAYTSTQPQQQPPQQQQQQQQQQQPQPSPHQQQHHALPPIHPSPPQALTRTSQTPMQSPIVSSTTGASSPNLASNSQSQPLLQRMGSNKSADTAEPAPASNFNVFSMAVASLKSQSSDSSVDVVAPETAVSLFSGINSAGNSKYWPASSSTEPIFPSALGGSLMSSPAMGNSGSSPLQTAYSSLFAASPHRSNASTSSHSSSPAVSSHSTSPQLAQGLAISNNTPPSLRAIHNTFNLQHGDNGVAGHHSESMFESQSLFNDTGLAFRTASTAASLVIDDDCGPGSAIPATPSMQNPAPTPSTRNTSFQFPSVSVQQNLLAAASSAGMMSPASGEAFDGAIAAALAQALSTLGSADKPFPPLT